MLGNRLKEYRTAKGWSIEELARRSDVSTQTIVKTERKGAVLSTLRQPTMHKLAKALGVSPYQLFPDPKEGE